MTYETNVRWRCATCDKVMYARYAPCDCPIQIVPEEDVVPKYIKDAVAKRRQAALQRQEENNK